VDGFDRLNPEICRQYEDQNPWVVRFTLTTEAIRLELERDPGVKAVLDRIRIELRTFPPTERWYSLGNDITGANLTVRVHMECGRRLELTAAYRLIAEECAIFQLELAGPDTGIKDSPRRQP
jgi:hypothetical protein